VGQTVWYRILSFNGGGSNASSVVSATTIVPATPENLSGGTFSFTEASFSWADVATDEAGYYVERCLGDSCTDFVQIASLPADSVDYIDATLEAGNIYRYRVRAFGNGVSAYSNVLAVATIAPEAPSDAVATAVSDSRIDITWTDNTAGDVLWNETFWVIIRCVGTGCTPIDVHTTLPPQTESYSDSLLTPGESYSYIVQAYNPTASTGVSGVLTATTNVPAIPTMLSDSTISATEIQLSWLDNATGETGYEIERCEGSGCSDFAPSDTTAADATSIVIGGLDGSAAHQFRVRAFNASGSSGYSNTVIGRADVPPAPTALAGELVSPSQLDLTWSDNAENETAYIVERCDGSGCVGFAVIDSIAADLSAFSDNTVGIDTVYRYRVRASNAVGPSAYTAEVEVSTYRPATPTGLAAQPISATRVDLTWTDVAANDTAIVVERCVGVDCSAFSELDVVAPAATSYSDTTATVNNWYAYRLRAINVAGSSAPTDSAVAGTFIPSDPSGLTAFTNSATNITLEWTDNSNTENDFVIQRCTGIGCVAYDSLDIVGADATAYLDVSASLGNSYSYRVIARGGGGNSNPSNVATAHTFPADPVATVTGSPLTATTLQLSWTAAEFATSYQIATVSGVDTTLFATTSAGITDTVLTVAPSVVYNFVVRGNNNAGSGAYAGTMVAMTPPPAPVSLTVFPLSTSQASLAWSDTSTRETGFEVERAFFSAGSFGAYATVASLGADVTSDVNTVPAPTGRYKYRVRAINLVGAGAYSNEVDLTLTGPLAPTALGAAVTAPGQISLNWTDNSDSEQSFSIERSVGNNLSFAQLATVGPGVQSHVDSSGLTINTAYFYRVRAVNNIGASGFTNEATVTTTVPGIVSGMSTVIQSSTSIQVNWNGAGTTGETGFRVYRCVGNGCTDFTLLEGGVAADAVTFTDVAASYGNWYRYLVRPYNIAGEPTGNATADRPLVLPTPSAVVALPADRTSMRVRWNPSSFTWETGFEIEECTGFGCTDFAPLTTVAANDSMTISSGLTANGTFLRYRVRAIADGNAGPWSSLQTSNTPVEVTLGDTLVTVTPEIVSATQNMFHYVVAMPAGSPTVEVSIGDDPGGTTTTGGSYIIMQRSQGIQRHANQLATVGTLGDTLCSPPVFIGAGNSGGCSLPHLGVTTDYYITTYSNPYSNLRLAVLPGPTLYTFNTCAQAGRVGPAQGQCDAAYTGTSLQTQVVVADSGFQDWTVPFSGRWAVTAIGAAGASAAVGFNGGRGAQIYGEFDWTAGQNLRLAVGQAGSGAGTSSNGGGGGGSFVYDVDGSTPLLIAGGGGGTRGFSSQHGCDASTTAFAGTGSGGSSTWPCSLKGGGVGEGGIVSAVSWGSAGAGFNSNGASDNPWGTGGRAWATFLVGGTDLCGGLGVGGFGAGGGGGGCNGGGGGGGYSGGDGGHVAGGGGSFNSGANAAAAAGVGTGQGTIILRYLGPL
jgi:fibronectin type 3 domain-containing protein